MTKKKLFVIFSSETTLILIHLSHGKRFDTKRPVFKVSHSARGGGLTPNETLSHSNGKFVFDHGPKFVNSFKVDFIVLASYPINSALCKSRST